MNMIVSEMTGLGPIALTPKLSELRISPKETEFLQKGILYRSGLTEKRIKVLSECLNQMSETVGKNYLVKSKFRMDPLLFKDHMNINHKRYQTMDRLKLA